jgi:ABC-type taurine transport system substrate-binding protein
MILNQESDCPNLIVAHFCSKAAGVHPTMKVLDPGTDMVDAMHNGEAQIGDMSVTTYLNAVHSDAPFKVIGIVMKTPLAYNANEPLAIVTKRSSSRVKSPISRVGKPLTKPHALCRRLLRRW